MTPLQRAAQQVIEQWDAPLWKNTISTAHFIAELRKALEAEQAQAVELVECAAIKNILDEYGLQAIDFVANFKQALEAEQAQAVEPVAELPAGECYRTGNTCAKCGHDEFIATPQAAPSTSPVAGERAELIEKLRNGQTLIEDEVRAASMLEADGKAQQVATTYNQQALELCPECGWKAIMPGEPCFVCNMQTEAQQVADHKPDWSAA